MNLRKLSFLSAIAWLGSVLTAQMPGIPPAELENMNKLSFMLGKWEGTGWMMTPAGQKHEFFGSENIQKKLQGRAILVEGLFFGSQDKERKGPPVHETLAVISYDAKAGAYDFTTYVARGGRGQHKFSLIGDKKWQWETGSANVRVRYITDFNDGDWYEIGERSTDGQQWTRFFEMRLKKQP